MPIKTETYISTKCQTLAQLKPRLTKDFTPYTHIKTDTLKIVRSNRTTRLELTLEDPKTGEHYKLSFMCTLYEGVVYINTASVDQSVMRYREDVSAVNKMIEDSIDTTILEQLNAEP